MLKAEMRLEQLEMQRRMQRLKCTRRLEHKKVVLLQKEDSLCSL